MVSYMQSKLCYLEFSRKVLFFGEIQNVKKPPWGQGGINLLKQLSLKLH